MKKHAHIAQGIIKGLVVALVMSPALLMADPVPQGGSAPAAAAPVSAPVSAADEQAELRDLDQTTKDFIEHGVEFRQEARKTVEHRYQQERTVAHDTSEAAIEEQE